MMNNGVEADGRGAEAEGKWRGRNHGLGIRAGRERADR